MSAMDGVIPPGTLRVMMEQNISLADAKRVAEASNRVRAEVLRRKEATR